MAHALIVLINALSIKSPAHVFCCNTLSEIAVIIVLAASCYL